MEIETHQILQRDPRAISRMISRIEQLDPTAFEILSNVDSCTGNAITLGITGAPGAGKSTLVNQLINHVRKLNKSVAVLAVDPSSPFSGGAILGDRIRMGSQYSDDNVYIRSLSSHGETGGVPMIIGSMTRLLDAAKFDFIFIETVGVGQTELKIMNVADLIAVVLTPESGDSIQMIKAGLMEIADIYVVNKSDRPGADRLVADINSLIISENNAQGTPHIVVQTEGTSGKGISDLFRGIMDYYEHMKNTDNLSQRKEMQRSNEASEIIKYLGLNYINELIQKDQDSQGLLNKVKSREADPYTTSRVIMEKLRDIINRE
tara:strand:+ start:13941 stop:14897 length:957 start_codon:yes stop_codon:yes gene_type:complete